MASLENLVQAERAPQAALENCAPQAVLAAGAEG